VAFKDMKIHAKDIAQAAARLEQLGYEVLQVKPTHSWIVADKDGFAIGWVAAKNIDFPVVKIEDLENAETK
jgi:hypothetical protein